VVVTAHDWEQMSGWARRLLAAAGMPEPDAWAFICETRIAALARAYSSVRPNGTVFREVFEALIDFRANGDPGGVMWRIWS
jgi:hypothetical protein